jgi:hypothetical protein
MKWRTEEWIHIQYKCLWKDKREEKWLCCKTTTLVETSVDEDYDGAVYKVITCNTEIKMERHIMTVSRSTMYYLLYLCTA